MKEKRGKQEMRRKYIECRIEENIQIQIYIYIYIYRHEKKIECLAIYRIYNDREKGKRKSRRNPPPPPPPPIYTEIIDQLNDLLQIDIYDRLYLYI